MTRSIASRIMCCVQSWPTVTIDVLTLEINGKPPLDDRALEVERSQKVRVAFKANLVSTF